MIKRTHLFKTILVSLALLAGLAVVLAPEAAYAAFQSNAADEACQGVSASGCGDGEGAITKLIRNVVNVLSIAAGIAAVFMFIIGGFMIGTSAGDSAKFSKGKQALVYATIGLVVVALSQFIVRFVLDKAAG